jgi:hypothetical protein
MLARAYSLRAKIVLQRAFPWVTSAVLQRAFPWVISAAKLDHRSATRELEAYLIREYNVIGIKKGSSHEDGHAACHYRFDGLGHSAC